MTRLRSSVSPRGAERLQRRAGGGRNPSAELERGPVVLRTAERHHNRVVGARRDRSVLAGHEHRHVGIRIPQHGGHVAARNALAEQRPGPVEEQ